MGNIISNALAYIDQPKGFVHIIIDDVPSLLPPSGYADLSLTKNVSIQIQDSGIGMDREYLEYHYFRPMKKENALKPGSGLSVHIAQRLVHTLGGKIAVSSQSGMVSLGQVVGQQEGRTFAYDLRATLGHDRAHRSTTDAQTDDPRAHGQRQAA